MSVCQVLDELEAAGISLRLDGRKVRIWYPEPEQREQLADKVAFLRTHREQVADFLRKRQIVPRMPDGIRLLAWNLKEPPVAIDCCSVVTDPAGFARTTLEQLQIALLQPKRWIGWSVPQLIDRLGQVGVAVTLESLPADARSRHFG
jgi:hypothetical protein